MDTEEGLGIVPGKWTTSNAMTECVPEYNTGPPGELLPSCSLSVEKPADMTKLTRCVCVHSPRPSALPTTILKALNPHIGWLDGLVPFFKTCPTMPPLLSHTHNIALP